MTQYTIGILPSPQIASIVQEFISRYPEYRHTTLPPHITLTPPFSIKPSLDSKTLLTKLEESTLGFPEFKVELTRINTFPGDRVIFIEPSPASSALIFKLSESIKLSLHTHVIDLSARRSLGIRAHLTLAKQVPKEISPQLLLEAHKIPLPLTFLCNSFKLFKKLDPSPWVEDATIFLS